MFFAQFPSEFVVGLFRQFFRLVKTFSELSKKFKNSNHKPSYSRKRKRFSNQKSAFKRVFHPFPVRTRSRCLSTGFSSYQDFFRTVKKIKVLTTNRVRVKNVNFFRTKNVSKRGFHLFPVGVSVSENPLLPCYILIIIMIG